MEDLGYTFDVHGVTTPATIPFWPMGRWSLRMV